MGLASSTKWVSGAIFLKLAEQQWLSLDDSIGMYLPVFTEYGKGHFTLRQAYSMSSGIFNPGTSSPYHRDPSLTLAQSADTIAKNVEILFEPGSMIGYDGTAMHVWGRAAEVIDSIRGPNRDWRTIAREEFFDLMQMDSTDYTDFYPNNPAVAGGIETTPCDYLRFLKMLSNDGQYNGVQVLQPSSIDEMFTDQTQSAPIYHTFWPSNHPDFAPEIDTLRYTFGAWWTEKDANGNITGLTSPGAYGHYPFIDRCKNIYGTFFTFIPVTEGGGKKVENTFLRFLKILREQTGECTLTSNNKSPRTHSNQEFFYPNPASNILYLNTLQLPPLNLTLQIFDISGRQVYSLPIHAQQTGHLDLEGVSNGVYIATISDPEGSFIRTDKLIIQK
ncbi:MAG: serine hydrolase [Bacteroidota bacterium]